MSYIHVAAGWMDIGPTKQWLTRIQPPLQIPLFDVKQTYNLNQLTLHHIQNIMDCGYMKRNLINQLLFSLSGRNLTLETPECFLS